MQNLIDALSVDEAAQSNTRNSEIFTIRSGEKYTILDAFKFKLESITGKHPLYQEIDFANIDPICREQIKSSPAKEKLGSAKFYIPAVENEDDTGIVELPGVGSTYSEYKKTLEFSYDAQSKNLVLKFLSMPLTPEITVIDGLNSHKIPDFKAKEGQTGNDSLAGTRIKDETIVEKSLVEKIASKKGVTANDLAEILS